MIITQIYHRRAGVLALVVLLGCLFGAGYAMAQQYPYPEGVREQYMQDCMAQPLDAQVGQRVSQEQRRAYCLCLFNFIRSKVPHEEYQRTEQMVRAGKLNLVTVKFQVMFTEGVNACGKRYILNQ